MGPVGGTHASTLTAGGTYDIRKLINYHYDFGYINLSKHAAVAAGTLVFGHKPAATRAHPTAAPSANLAIKPISTEAPAGAAVTQRSTADTRLKAADGLLKAADARLKAADGRLKGYRLATAVPARLAGKGELASAGDYSTTSLPEAAPQRTT
jgi:hypothetical protein